MLYIRFLGHHTHGAKLPLNEFMAPLHTLSYSAHGPAAWTVTSRELGTLYVDISPVKWREMLIEALNMTAGFIDLIDDKCYARWGVPADD